MSATDLSDAGGLKKAAYADTSFLMSLMLEDANSKAARLALSHLGKPLSVSALGKLEFRTAFMRKLGLKEIEAPTAVRLLDAFHRRFLRGFFVDAEAGSEEVWRTADEVSNRQSASIQHRSLDVWHVAIALAASAEAICTFDEKMRKAAELEGLTIIS